MSIHSKRIFDPEEPLRAEGQEAFVNEYLRLDIEENVLNIKARKLMAYRAAYPENIHETDTVVLKRANVLMRKKELSARLRHLYDTEENSIDQEYKWTKGKSQDVLIGIVHSDENKTGDKLKAVDMLNKMKGIDSPTEVSGDENEKDTVSSFFDKIGEFMG